MRQKREEVRRPAFTGCQVKAGDSLVVYSRDAMAHPMRLLVRLIMDVKSGKFDPDLTRSGTLASELAGESEYSEGSTDEECKQVSEEERAVEDVVGE